ncbi:hypothetical protein SAMN05421734_11325 [Pelagirhabdus alkalitolerans]|uniref:Uncharacterized protein n=1 Tax=Pelagirhabdus alkalitolerans TaxID=1612202 RepID=A0A1G6MZW3_9BACI|nr:hypothetical protein [Pelagirhabdus alkalitolerans]SDC61092.1 hypothetical protein SAMN05421734_11325 [Pelagirhabdus alkalitolerans]
MSKYWKVILSYGHVGKRNEVSVSRYLATPNKLKLLDVYDLASSMPGVKKSRGGISAIRNLKQISYEDYLLGKEEENEDPYLKQLMSFSPDREKNIA